MGTTPTTRLTGKDASIWVGTSAGATDVYAGADMKNCRASMNGTVVDLSANTDDWVVEKVVRGQLEISCEKIINATATFSAIILDAINDGEAIFAQIRSSGGLLYTGLFNVISQEFNLSDASPAMENLTLRSTGAVTVS